MVTEIRTSFTIVVKKIEQFMFVRKVNFIAT